ncbi:MAG: GNAT family N-acetyltransferase [Chloroflexota bacterium]
MIASVAESQLKKLIVVKPHFELDAVESRLAWLKHSNAEWLGWHTEDGQISGWVLINWDGKASLSAIPYIFDLYVLESRRGIGIGSLLLVHCERLALQRGCKQISLAVNPDLNPRAVLLYERLGYRPVDGVKYLDGVYNGDEDWVINMIKAL